MPRINFDKTFTPVTKMKTIRILTVLATHFGWEIEQMDVKNAFLNGDLHEEVFMVRPL
eukprot:c44351_g1_i1 orf=52-225(+)